MSTSPPKPRRARTGVRSNRRYGAEAEASARAHLSAQGYVVLAQNYTVRGGEVDVVARDGGTLAFIEVKARRSAAFGPAIVAVDARKQRRMTVAANRYLCEHPVECEVRFDVVCRDGGDDAPWVLFKDAFRPEAEP